MRMLRFFALLVLASLPLAAFADNITIFNTGVNSLGTQLGLATLDTHYTITSSPYGAVSAHTPSNTGYPFSGTWLTAGSSLASNWIVPTGTDSTASGPIGTYTYETTFDLTGLQPGTAILAGRWSSDNNAQIWLNGVNTGLVTSSGAFGSWTAFNLSSGFVAGVNTLEFKVYNGGGPTGLRAEFTTAEANAIPSQVPEPASLLLLGTGLLGVARKIRKRA